MLVNPMDYTLYVGDTDVNANYQVTVLGMESKKQEKLVCPNCM